MIKPIFQNDNIILYHGDCREILPQIPQKFDACITDPPYVMLKIQWDAEDVFKSVIPLLCSKMNERSSFVFFGRGDTFFSHNLQLQEEGYNFKEGIVWNKCRVCSPLNAVPRAHEDIAIRTRKKTINKIRVPTEDFPVYNIPRYHNDIRRIKDICASKDTEALRAFIADRHLNYKDSNNKSAGLSVQKNIKQADRGLTTLKSILEGKRPQSIITVPPKHFGKVHPTQKPDFLMQTLIKLTTDPTEWVIDPFAGSGATGIAALATNRRAILIERETAYCQTILERIQNFNPLHLETE